MAVYQNRYKKYPRWKISTALDTGTLLIPDDFFRLGTYFRLLPSSLLVDIAAVFEMFVSYLVFHFNYSTYGGWKRRYRGCWLIRIGLELDLNLKYFFCCYVSYLLCRRSESSICIFSHLSNSSCFDFYNARTKEYKEFLLIQNVRKLLLNN